MTLPPESYDKNALNSIEDSIKAAKEILAQSPDSTHQQPELGSIALSAEKLLQEQIATEQETIEKLKLGIDTMAHQVFANKPHSHYITEDGRDFYMEDFVNQFKIEPKHDGSGEMVIYYYPEGNAEPSYVLDLHGHGLSKLDIPAELQITTLICTDNQLTSFGNLPTGLTWLACGNNKLTNLDNLPAGLTKLVCAFNQLTSLDNLPARLSELVCPGNQLTSLDNLPAVLTELDCSGNQLTTLNNLPTGLTKLDCSFNEITCINNLPTRLARLNCIDNQLTTLDNLPAGLTTLVCTNNQLTTLDNLPDGLTILNCIDNPLNEQSKEYIKSRGFF